MAGWRIWQYFWGYNNTYIVRLCSICWRLSIQREDMGNRRQHHNIPYILGGSLYGQDGIHLMAVQPYANSQAVLHY